MPANLSTQGVGLDSQSTAKLLEVVSKLRQELLQSRSETQKVTDNLNCLISLVKRAWYGEKTATLHLANIVGAPAQEATEGGRFGNLGAGNSKTRAVTHWERLSIRLLQREYELVQEEIRHRQAAYLENRQHYMEEIMASHYRDMSRTSSLGRRANSASALNNAPVENVDQTFLKTFKGRSKRPPSGKTMTRAKSAGHVRSKVKATDILDRADVTLRELVSHPDNTDPAGHTMQEAVNGLMETDPDRQTVDERYLSTYDDPQRYTQSNLFDLDQVFGRDSFVRKNRPMSAAFMKERDAIRARPKSASSTNMTNGEFFITQKGERPLKYETTRPTSQKGGSRQLRQRRHSGAEKHLHYQNRDRGSRRSSVSEIELPSEDAHPPMAPHPSDEEIEKIPSGPTPEQIAARERAAELRLKIEKATKRPECVDRFEQDLEEMTDMERQFRQKTLHLQKKLGIGGKGIIY